MAGISGAVQSKFHVLGGRPSGQLPLQDLICRGGSPQGQLLLQDLMCRGVGPLGLPLLKVSIVQVVDLWVRLWPGDMLLVLVVGGPWCSNSRGSEK